MPTPVSSAEVLIIGGCIESYWAAIALARLRGVLSQSITLINDNEQLNPVVSAGDWIEEFHEWLGISHDVFLKRLRPRISLGLQLGSEHRQVFIPAAPTGISLRNCSFSRLYAAIARHADCNFMDFNFATFLEQSGTVAAPPNVGKAMAKGLNLIFHWDAVAYKKFLAESIDFNSVKVKSVAANDVGSYLSDAICDDGVGSSSSSANPPVLANPLVLDFHWRKPWRISEVELFGSPQNNFFGKNEVFCDLKFLHYSLAVNQSRRFKYAIPLGEILEFEEDLLMNSPANYVAGRTINMGAKHSGFSPFAVEETVFYRQLQTLIDIVRISDHIDIFARKLNRQWCAWQNEIDDVISLIFSVLRGNKLSERNAYRSGLFQQVGMVPLEDARLIDEGLWENMLVAGLGVQPGYRGAPNEYSLQEAVGHLKNIRQSFFSALSK
ncbi:MAG: tryptophan 7-halogenase [Marinagarivorans sp.]